MILSEFEKIVSDWCTENDYIFNGITICDNEVEIHRSYEILGVYGSKKMVRECYHCYLNNDMTFKNVPHGMKGKIKNKKLIKDGL